MVPWRTVGCAVPPVPGASTADGCGSNAWINATNARPVDGTRHNVPDLLMKKGSADNLKVSVRWGCNPKARQIGSRCYDSVPGPWTLQCAWGVVSSVSVITRSTSSSATARGRPLRGSSSSPSSLRFKNRERHFPTVCFDTANWTDTAVLFRPSAPLRMILPAGQSLRRFRPAGPSGQGLPFLVVQRQRWKWSSHGHIRTPDAGCHELIP